MTDRASHGAAVSPPPCSWWIQLTHPRGHTSITFYGTRAEADAKAAGYIGKPASWNANKHPHEPNLWDCYTEARIEEVVSVGAP